MDKAAARLERAISRGETIAVWGDFDVDGQTATTLLVSTLRDLDAHVTFHIPVRAVEGHGVNLPALTDLIGRGARVLLTCDTGVDAHEAIDYARQRDVDVIVTDHHDLPATLPSALAIVNPKLLAAGHPLGSLPGVGVAYKLAEALYQQAGRARAVEQYLDLAALGIVADLAVQTGDTRYLVQRGLAALRAAPRLGLLALLETAEINAAWLSEEHIGFELAPRLNALGRLADANLAVEFLTSQDVGRVRVLATMFEGLNNERKRLTDQVFQGALAQIERDPSLLEHAALVLAHADWPAGVIGIVASRLVERYDRPAVLLSAPPGQIARGSARSVEGCDISAAIAAQRDLLAGFGGHPMAAGLSIAPERIPELRRRLSRAVQAQLGALSAQPTLRIDGYLPLAELSLELVADLERLAPFGPGNPPLVLASRGVTLKSASAVGRTREHMQLVVEDEGGTVQRVIWWQGAGWPLPEGRFDLAYSVRASTYRGQRAVQVEWVAARAQPLAEPAAVVAPRPAIQIIDYRGEAQPLALLQGLRRRPEMQVWCEADARRELHGQDRYQLAPGAHLAIWTTPPGFAELQAVLQRVAPHSVYLFAVEPGFDRAELFLPRLAGLVKHALAAHAGHTSVAALAAATAQRESTVRLGLRWLAGRGHVRLVSQQDDSVQLEAGAGQAGPELPAIAAQLREMLEETAAYRRYFAQADPEGVIGDR